MVLIISNEHDVSTKKVIDWLLHFEIPYVVINEEDLVNKCSIRVSGNEINIVAELYNNKQINLNEVKAFWYRRGAINKSLPKLIKETIGHLKEEHLNSEWNRLQILIHRIIEGKPGINNFETALYFNKLYQLVVAKEIGLKFPESLVSNSVDDLLEFKRKHHAIITKNIERDFNKYQDKLNVFTTGTNRVEEKNILNLRDGALPSLVQKVIEKKYELRIFFLDGRFWAMCILHNQSHSEIDYRSLNGQLRMVPYQLPDNIEDKLTLLMDRLHLNCGSVDMLVGFDNEFYFLEVNPVGQYDFVSVLCNYNIHKEIALYLKNFV